MIGISKRISSVGATRCTELLLSCQKVAACSSGCERCTVPYKIGRDDAWPETLLRR
jgi:hypothetical protein